SFFCAPAPPVSSGQLATPALNRIANFNLPSISWQWMNAPSGVSILPASGTSSLGANGYALPTFTFTNSNVTDGGEGQANFVVFRQTTKGVPATEGFTLPLDRSVPKTFCATLAGRRGAKRRSIRGAGARSAGHG